MKKIRYLFAALALSSLCLSSCESGGFLRSVVNPQRPRAAAEQEIASEPAYFVLKQGIKSYFKAEPKNVSELDLDFCNLKTGKKYTYSGAARLSGKHYYFEVTNTEFDCAFRGGYVYSEHITLGGGQAQGGSSGGVGSSLCQHSWEERPGTTDYTTFDAYRGISIEGDRPQSQTLIGSGVQKNRSLCEKARALQHCFRKTIVESDENAAVRFRAWASARGIDPVRALMAKTEQETLLGSVKDSCRSGVCNGIGLAQIITAIDENGRVLSDSDSRWDGITFNILTNLKYSVRVVSEKIAYSDSLYQLAYYYNGSSTASDYARKVEGFYRELLQCRL
ncbi:MAG: hypothetical protein RL189_942 [Pseudomonadota bacterium]|jgi:hypothetical protein